MALTKVKGHILADDLALGGNPTTSTQSTGNNTTRIATTAFVQTELSALVDSSPSALNTLNELAAALGDDANFSTTVNASIAAKAPLASPSLTGAVTVTGASGAYNTLQLTSNSTSHGTIINLGDTSDADYGSITQFASSAGEGGRMRFIAGTTETMNLRGGKVGIGTNNPSQKLSVSDGMHVTEANATAADTGGSYTVSIGSNASAKSLITKGNINVEGSLSVGTTSPRRQMHIHNSASATVGLMLTNGNTGESNDSQGFQFKVANDSHAEISQMENSDLRIFTNALERMRIDATGLVHIGTNRQTDHKGLDINKSTNDIYQPNTFNEESLLRLNVPNATGNYAGITYTHAGGTEFFTGFVRVGGTSDIADYILQGYNGNTNAYQEYMRIASSGNVGIGVTPKTDWHTGYRAIQIGESSAFFANTAADEIFMVQNARYTSGGWKYNSSGTATLFDMQSGNTRWRRAASGSDNGTITWSDSMFINTSGNVGIGTTSVETELHVKGTNNSAGDLYTQVGPGNTPSITIQNAGTTNNNNAALYFRDDTDMRASVGAKFVNHSTNESELRFSTTDGSGNTRERVTFKGDGDIGFGTTAPQSYGGRNFEFYDASTAQTGIRISASASQFEVGTDSTGGYLQPIAPGDGITFFSANTAAADTIAMKVHSTGQVTTPKTPAFRAYLSTEQTSNGTITTGFTDNNTTASRAYDNNGDFNTTTGRFTAPVSGVYIFSIMWDSNASLGGFNVLVNGSNYNVMWEPTGISNAGWESRYFGTHMKLSTNDYVQLTVVHASGTHPVHMGAGLWGHFAGCLVG